MIILNTTCDELKAKWKQMYRLRKVYGPLGAMPSDMNYGYFTGKMEYTAWLLVNGQQSPVIVASDVQAATVGNGGEATK